MLTSQEFLYLSFSRFLLPDSLYSFQKKGYDWIVPVLSPALITYCSICCYLKTTPNLLATRRRKSMATNLIWAGVGRLLISALLCGFSWDSSKPQGDSCWELGSAEVFLTLRSGRPRFRHPHVTSAWWLAAKNEHINRTRWKKHHLLWPVLGYHIESLWPLSQAHSHAREENLDLTSFGRSGKVSL